MILELLSPIVDAGWLIVLFVLPAVLAVVPGKFVRLRPSLERSLLVTALCWIAAQAHFMFLYQPVVSHRAHLNGREYEPTGMGSIVFVVGWILPMAFSFGALVIRSIASRRREQQHSRPHEQN
ncbi:MAG: hypothetical protein K1X78_25695 [Verrucomicrobiaceae bacterium]|nr:hypothetical protein [Verrucomicrobiaceae bacterium]